MEMINRGLLECFTDLLDCEDTKILHLVLAAFENIMNSKPWNKDQDQAFFVNPIITIINQRDGVEKLEKLASHPNKKIQEQAQDLLSRLFES